LEDQIKQQEEAYPEISQKAEKVWFENKNTCNQLYDSPFIIR
jgi:hypothetical protein